VHTNAEPEALGGAEDLSRLVHREYRRLAELGILRKRSVSLPVKSDTSAFDAQTTMLN
jgi:hypothetical protein